MMQRALFLICAFILMTTGAFGQVNRKFIDTGTVNNQFDYLVKKSSRYQDYKVVKINWLSQIKSNVNDSLSKLNKTIDKHTDTINIQRNTINSLKQSITSHTSNIESLSSEKQQINLFGVPMNKGFFKTVMFAVVLGLLLLLLYFIVKFNRSNRITQQTKLVLKELEEEFDTHRKTAIEREQKVRRALQDELNKQNKE